MTYEELIARDKSLTEAKDQLIHSRVGATDFARRTLTHAWDYLYAQSVTASADLKEYFSQETPTCKYCGVAVSLEPLVRTDRPTAMLWKHVDGYWSCKANQFNTLADSITEGVEVSA